jgi:hypothetical protein
MLHVSTYNLGHHQAPLLWSITQVIKINSHDMDPYVFMQHMSVVASIYIFREWA